MPLTAHSLNEAVFRRIMLKLPVFMANPPSSAISNRNSPRKIGTYNNNNNPIMANYVRISDTNAF
jgi:hypothetical protein